MTIVRALKKLMNNYLSKSNFIRDVLLLADMYQIFWKESTNSFKLDPIYFVFTPGYSWDTMKMFVDVRLKIILDIENYQFIESLIKGDISMIFKGYTEANQKKLV